jgi:hypothetical protein
MRSPVRSWLLALIVVLAGTLARGTITVAQSVERTCTGEFTDMRVIGVTLGDCDLNNISDNELGYVKHICGEPWTSDSDNKAKKCTIRVISARTKSLPTENHGYGAALYQVRKVLMTEPR